MKRFKKYILFGYHIYYPLGALEDIIDSFDSIKDAKEATKELDNQVPGPYCLNDIYKIVDRDTWETVWAKKEEEEWKNLQKTQP